MTLRFENLNTYLHAVNEGRVDELNDKFDEAVKEVRGRFGKTYPLIINGKEVQGTETFPVVNPANTTEVLAHFQKASKAQVDEAVAAAKAAFKLWGHTHYEKRAAIFRRAADLMEERFFEFAALMTLENGKNRFESYADVDEAVDFLRFYAYELERHHGYEHVLGSPTPGERTVSVLRPCGVFGVVSPFNFPVAITCGMTTGALITGNTVVLKPASDTPWTAYAVATLLHEAGVPKEALNFVTGGGRDVGQPLVDHPDLAGLVFTGSRPVGMKNFANFVGKKPRPYIAEMGGKNAVIVTEKADLEKAITGTANAAFGFSGQKCSAASRAYVHHSLHDAFVKGVAEKAKAFKPGMPEDKDAQYGPVINEESVNTYKEAVEIAKRDGQVLAGGRTLDEGAFANGYYVEPTVVAGLPLGHDLELRELFVPFIAIFPVDSLDQAIERVNAADYGLTGGIFSEDADEVQHYFDTAEVGVVYANRGRSASTGAMVFGQSFVGWKFSGTTGKGAGGPWYLPQFMREQSRTIVE